jgi:hypothetical protein
LILLGIDPHVHVLVPFTVLAKKEIYAKVFPVDSKLCVVNLLTMFSNYGRFSDCTLKATADTRIGNALL